MNTFYNENSLQIYQVFNGAFSLSYRQALGTLGATFKTKYYAKYKKNYDTNALLAYDTAYLYAYTISGMINRGENYDNGKQLTDSLRGADFTGASGKLKFSDGTNDRSAYGYTINNIQNKNLVAVYEYDPTNSNIFTRYPNVSIL